MYSIEVLYIQYFNEVNILRKRRIFSCFLSCFISILLFTIVKAEINMTSIPRINNFINGRFVLTESYLESINPSTEEVIAHIADSSVENVQQAVQAARQAFPSYV